MTTSTVDIKELRAAFFDMTDEFFVILDKEFNIVDVSQALLNNISLTKKKVIGRHITEISPGIEKTERYRIYQEVLKTGKTMKIDELQSSTVIQGKIYSKVKVFKLGEGIGVVGQNITDLRKAVIDLETTRDELEETNAKLAYRNKDLEEMSYVAAHDLKAPLNNLTSLLEIMEREGGISESGDVIFEKVKEVTKSMLTKIHSLNNMIKLKASLGDQTEQVDMELVLERVKGDISQQIKKANAKIKADFSRCPVLQYSQIQIHSILHNLVTNSLKYRNPEKQVVIKMKTTRQGVFTKLVVSDNGLGFDESIDQNQLFGLFKRVHTHVEGVGMGLYIVNSIVRSNGGRIDVKSKPGAGATFTIYL
jgi:signal transduction histidine kinase